MLKLARIIKGLAPSLVERGKIKIGEKGKHIRSQKGTVFQPPKKLNHFKVVLTTRGQDGNFLLDDEIHSIHGDYPKTLPVRLLYDDPELNFSCRYTCYKGRTLWCSGDGENANRLQEDGTLKERACPCRRQDPQFKASGKDPACKIASRLSVIIDGAKVVGGVWVFRSTSYNTVTGLIGSLALIKSITGGPLAGIPLQLRITPKLVQSPLDGRQQTIYVVSLEYEGSFEQLRKIGFKTAIDREQHKLVMGDIEAQAQKLIALDQEPSLVDEDVVDEFYPEQAAEQEEDQQETEVAQTIDDFIEAAAASEQQAVLLREFITEALKSQDMTEEAFIASARTHMAEFMAVFENWVGAIPEEQVEDVARQSFQGEESHPEPDDPEPEENWWEDHDHWQHRRQQVYMDTVRLGLGLNPEGDPPVLPEQYDAVQGTLRTATTAVKKAVRAGYVRRFKLAAWDALVAEIDAKDNPQDSEDPE